MQGKRHLALALGLVAVAVAVPRSREGARYGCVDLDRAFAAYRRMGSPSERIEAFKKEQEAYQASLRSQIVAVRGELMTQGAVLSEEEKKKKEDHLRSLLLEMRALEKEQERKLESLQKELVDEILSGVHALGKSGGYTHILEKKAVLYGPDYRDVTDEVVRRLGAREGNTNR